METERYGSGARSQIPREQAHVQNQTLPLPSLPAPSSLPLPLPGSLPPPLNPLFMNLLKPILDPITARNWIYPTNYPVRQYQLDICQQALFNNTLVCLPTGLGKTLIAAVVMYNFYRWFPEGMHPSTIVHLT
jgi:hypothetical protein